jgi:hypothetical protein
MIRWSHCGWWSLPNPDRQTVGLDHDYQRVKPPNGDGFVNWLTTEQRRPCLLSSA